MSAQAVPAPPRAAAARADDRAGAPPRRLPMALLLLACLGLAALSLLLPSTPTYDPWAWIIWGREITQWDLVTMNGPSWKPLPVLLTTPFALAGDDAAPALWLMIARAGGLLAFAMAYRLGARLAGPWAGAIAAVALFLSDEFIFNFARGNSEGMLVALVLWAVERHLDGHRTHAFLLGFAAALLRPEVWPFLGLYGIWRKRDESILTDQRILLGKGVIRRDERSIGLHRVQDVSVAHRAFYSYADITIDERGRPAVKRIGPITPNAARRFSREILRRR